MFSTLLVHHVASFKDTYMFSSPLLQQYFVLIHVIFPVRDRQRGGDVVWWLLLHEELNIRSTVAPERRRGSLNARTLLPRLPLHEERF